MLLYMDGVTTRHPTAVDTEKKDFLFRIGISNYMGACNKRGRLSCFPS